MQRGEGGSQCAAVPAAGSGRSGPHERGSQSEHETNSKQQNIHLHKCRHTCIIHAVNKTIICVCQ